MISEVRVYDLRDAPRPADREAVLRLIDEGDCTVMQGQIYGDNPRVLGELLAERLGVKLRYHGPAPGSTAKSQLAIAAETGGEVLDVAEAEDHQPAHADRSPVELDVVAYCLDCSGVTGWVQAGAACFAETLIEWSEQGRPTRRLTTAVAKKLPSCRCKQQPDRATKQKALFS